MSAAGSAAGLDHVGVVTADLDAAAAKWQALGFTVQPLAVHMNDGVPTGTGNRNIMLRRGYIELLATIDPARPSATLARFLARHAGAHILTLAMNDAEAALARLQRAGFTASLTRSSRAADPQDPHGPQARFARIPLPDADPRLQLLHQLTPELVWQGRFLTHPNHAIALRAVIIAADAPAVFAARLSRAAGSALSPDPAGGYALTLPGCAIRILPPRQLAAALPGVEIPTLPAIVGLLVQTDDSNQAIERLFPQASAHAGGRIVRAGGVTIQFMA